MPTPTPPSLRSALLQRQAETRSGYSTPIASSSSTLSEYESESEVFDYECLVLHVAKCDLRRTQVDPGGVQRTSQARSPTGLVEREQGEEATCQARLARARGGSSRLRLREAPITRET